MNTIRETELMRTWNIIRKRPFISIAELEIFLDQVYNLTMNYKDTRESRDLWKKKYYDLKKQKFNNLKRKKKGGTK